MLGELFERRGDGEKFVPADAAVDDVGDDGLALRDGAGLVEHDGVDAVRRLKRFGGLDEDAVHRATTRADHDGRRRGETQRAGAADDENGNTDG